MVDRGDEFTHFPDLTERETAWSWAGTARTVIELAALLAVDPCVVAAGSEAEDLQRARASPQVHPRLIRTAAVGRVVVQSLQRLQFQNRSLITRSPQLFLDLDESVQRYAKQLHAKHLEPYSVLQ